MHISAPGTAFRERHKKDKMHISAPTTGLRGKSKTKTKAKHSASPVPSLGGSASNLVPGLPDSTELGGSIKYVEVFIGIQDNISRIITSKKEKYTCKLISPCAFYLLLLFHLHCYNYY